jgi:hypothetical protein
MRKLEVDVIPGGYLVAALAPDQPIPPDLLTAPGLVSVTRTPTEVSVVCPVEYAPPAGLVRRGETGWRLLTVRGPLEFSLTGIMATLSGTLAAAGVALLALSTFETDHLLVRDDDLERAVRALREAGHEVRE